VPHFYPLWSTPSFKYAVCHVGWPPRRKRSNIAAPTHKLNHKCVVSDCWDERKELMWLVTGHDVSVIGIMIFRLKR
jgi:hypothetical protein